VDIKKNAADETQSATCFKTLLLYLGNIAKAPEEEKFRVINTNNAAFQKRVDAVKGGRAFLETFGFEPDEAKGTLTLPRNKVDQVLLQMTGAEINGALTNPFFGVL
jgi:16S rRNA U1498 N3-methylase RsmE